MNYPNSIKKNYSKNVNYGNRGMDLENLINIMNERYIENDIAIIYKKPTPIQVVKYNYDLKRITDAYYMSASTLDYNGIYRGYYIEFDAKNTNLSYLPLSNIADHQIKHIERIIKHNGIAFLIIMINGECYLLPGEDLIDFINTQTRKSIPYDYIKSNGYKLEMNYLRGVDYIDAVKQIINKRRLCDEKNKNQEKE